MSRRWSIEEFDPNWPEFIADPFPFYARLRSEDPFHYVDNSGSWWASRHVDAMRILTDRRFGRMAPDGAGKKPPVVHGLEGIEKIPPSMLYQDPPSHTRLRSTVAGSFSPGAMAGIVPRVQQIADWLLDEVEPDHKMDLVSDFSLPLPIAVICELFGVPSEDRQVVRRWSEQIILSLDETQPEQVQTDAISARIKFAEYMAELITESRRWEGGGLLSDLIVSRDGGKLDSAELISMCVLMLIAGHANTTNVISGAVLALKESPEQLTLLRNRPEMRDTAVEEFLRYVSPVHRTQRFALEDFEAYGKTIRKGDVVTALLSSANRDENVFATPDSLDITRNPNQHLSFGMGTHFCLGAPLARIEISVGLTTLYRRCPGLRLAGQLRWRPGTAVRGLAELPVAF